MLIPAPNNKGQGLLETIVAIGIIVSGIVGMMNLTLSNQSATSDSLERLLATNLAREAIEVARNIRDTNWLSCEIITGTLTCNAWDKNLEAGTDVVAAPLFDIDTNTWTIDFTATGPTHNYSRVFRRNSGTAATIGTQFQSTEATPTNATQTPFNRVLELYSICADKTVSSSCGGANPKIGMRVQAKVSWDSRGKSNELVVEERLFNWR
jgi:Tfp pilus assembly protein PilV